ncbi:SLC13 family permease [Aquimonas voraii]|uniref:TrkA-C domain-containing protein n=1 Tax=Aquimonas voraii TaxID=265719 RepID=A0A1G6VED6_9GAMM|nr:SLC13 family permease [Aquimonas voraii]SDD51992.1 TrkA-C domain-containing protein [Aquimonas voraii]
MSTEQILILLILAATVGLFLWGRFRHDVVAMAALLACVAAGLVAPGEAFAGFGHPAVITVACVLVLSRSLQLSGAVDVLTQRVLPAQAGPTLSLAALTALAALLSAFMNNVGALALLMPVALQLARRLQLPPGRLLMPLAFASILGGMTTLIGTPPNLIVSGFRAETAGAGFGMFDFSPVGVAVALSGLLLIVAGGWRLVPSRREATADSFESGAYLTEARVPEGSPSAGKSLYELEDSLDELGAQVLALVRDELRLNAPNPARRIRAGDILVIEAEAESLAKTLDALGLKLEEDKRHSEKANAVAEASAAEPSSRLDGGAAAGMAARSAQPAAADIAEAASGAAPKSVRPEPSRSELGLVELVVLPGASIVGRSPTDLQLRTRHGINLLAVSRQGRRSLSRLRALALQPGDLLLMQGTPEALSGFATEAGCVPLAERELRIPERRKALVATSILLAAIGASALGVPAAVAFAGGALASLLLRTLPERATYAAIDWPVIVLLAALIPVAGAMESSGAAGLIAALLMEDLARGQPVLALALVMVVTMTLSDLMNNAATAAVMCPIAVSAAASLDCSADPFLMAVAIGASCAFLTPIGHQNNTLILGPGGFRFGDYWRLGLPVQLAVLLVSMPMLLWVWPL